MDKPDTRELKLALLIGVVLSTLNDVGFTTERALYTYFGSDIYLYNGLKRTLLLEGLINIQDHVVTLTPHGKKLAENFDKVFPPNRPESPETVN